jgi:hypothetical protein
VTGTRFWGSRQAGYGVGRLIEVADVLFDLHAQMGAGHDVVGIGQVDVAHRVDLVLGVPIGQLIRRQGLADAT